MANLKKLNLIAGIFHLTVFIILSCLWGFQKGEYGGVTTDTWTVQSENNKIVTVKNVPTSSSSLLMVILLFVFITSFVHFLMFGLRKYLETVINNQNNPLRWIEYAVTSSLMLLALLYSVGEKQLDVIILSVVVNAVVMLLGNVIESSKKSNRNVSIQLTVCAWILYTVVWFALIRCAVNTVRNNEGVPKWVPAIVFSEALTFSSFAVVQALFIANKISFEQGEFSYTVLSFVSKAILAFVVFTGVLKRPPTSSLNVE
jgi:hypothetical protein